VLPLGLLWMIREISYSASLLAISTIGAEKRSHLVLCGVSELAGLVLSVPFKLRLKRVKHMAGILLVLAVAGLSSVVFRVPESCLDSVCYEKSATLLCTMLTRFADAMFGSVLITYSMEAFDSDTRALALALCVALSSLGSILIPVMNIVARLGVPLLGFIGACAVLGLMLTPDLQET
jgi:hypothetical protein